MTELIDLDSPEGRRQYKEDLEQAVKDATAIKIMVSTDGWQILLNSFDNMKQDQLDVLALTPPGDEKAVLAAHAVWAATVHSLDQIVKGVNEVLWRGEEARKELERIDNFGPLDETDLSI